MTRDNKHGRRGTRILNQPGLSGLSGREQGSQGTPSDFTFQELEARLLLSASGLGELNKQPLGDIDAWLNRSVASVDLPAQSDHSGTHGIVEPGDDHGNDAANSTFVQTDTTIFGDIEVAADQDWFNFLGQTGIEYTFATQLLGITDTSLVLYDTDGTTVLAFDDDGGPGLADLLVWTAPSQGTYFLAVRGFDTETGAYSLSMSDTAIPTGEIRGSKWNDLNQDGIRDLNEPGLEGWVIFIDENRNRKRESSERFVITDQNGDYVFENMRPGTYTIAEKAQPGWQQTAPGADGATASSNPPAPVVVPGTVLFDTPAPAGDDTPIGFTASGDKWPQPGGLGTTAVITYSFSNLLDGGLLGGLSASAIQTGIEEALNLWASFSPLKFVAVSDSGPLPDDLDTSYPAGSNPDIRFGRHDIDGDSGVLAHAFFPTGTGLAGDVHFDSGDTWSIGPGGNSIDLIEVAVHEIGHSLGLGHEPSPPGGMDAIMNPFYGERYDGFGTSFLLDDDVAGVQSLYGEVQSLLGVWTVTINNPGEFADGIDFGSFLNDDHGNDQAGATSVGPPTIIVGSIESFGDVDWFSFEAGQGQSFSFETLLTNGIEDTVIRLIGPDGTTLIGSDDDSGIALASKLPWVAPSPGTYYMEVSGFNANIGDYSLRLAAAPTGDINVDGFVGVDDLNIILNFWNQNVPVGDVSSGDPSFDGFVGIDDLNIVLGNWNNGTPPPATSLQASGSESVASATNDGGGAQAVTAVESPVQADPGVVVAATEPQSRRARARRVSDSPPSQAASKPVNRLDRAEGTLNAVAAWSRKPGSLAVHTPLNPFTSATDSDDSEGLLGLWSGSVEG
jgi:Matrixin/SdrD B-like domain/Bacterial pre-peptidase C-terminal domain